MSMSDRAKEMVDPEAVLSGLVDDFTLKHLLDWCRVYLYEPDEDKRPFLMYLVERWTAGDADDLEYDFAFGWPRLRDQWHSETGRY